MLLHDLHMTMVQRSQLYILAHTAWSLKRLLLRTDLFQAPMLLERLQLCLIITSLGD